MMSHVLIRFLYEFCKDFGGLIQYLEGRFDFLKQFLIININMKEKQFFS